MSEADWTDAPFLILVTKIRLIKVILNFIFTHTFWYGYNLSFERIGNNDKIGIASQLYVVGDDCVYSTYIRYQKV
jgi:hypothetical protein